MRDLTAGMSDVIRRMNSASHVEHAARVLPESHAFISEPHASRMRYDSHASRVCHVVVARLVAGRLAQTEISLPVIPSVCPRLQQLDACLVDVEQRAGDELARFAERLDVSALRQEFHDRGDGDPVLQFYESFLAAEDRPQRRRRGVFYTPRPVAAFLVREIDRRLAEDGGFQAGLADERVGIVDPAAGTGTFLVEAVSQIHRRLVANWIARGDSLSEIERRWQSYVPANLLPRLTGCELLPAACAVSQVRIAAALAETGYRFTGDERLRIFLGDSLAPPEDTSWRDRTYQAIVGNPPFRIGAHRGNAWLDALCEPLRMAVRGERNIQPLSDDYVKFLALACRLARDAGGAAIGFVANRTFLDGRIHRGLRSLLRESFGRLSLIDLGGDLRDGSRPVRDENVFDITQGVALVLGSPLVVPVSCLARSELNRLTRSQRRRGAISHARVAVGSGLNEDTSSLTLPRIAGDGAIASPEAIFRATLTGSRQEKFARLELGDIPFQPLDDPGADERWARSITSNDDVEAEYLRFPSLCELMTFRSPGVKTSCDSVAYAFTLSELEEQVRAAGWDWEEPRAIRSLYRPGDVRWLYYDPARLGRPRPDLARHVLPENTLSLITMRQFVGEEFTHVGVCRGLACHGVFYLGNRGQDYQFPVTLNTSSGPQANLNRDLLPPSLHDPRSFVNYAVAVLLSSEYRRKYRALLPRDFPRIPIFDDPAIVESLCRLGGEWVAWQLWQQHGEPAPGNVQLAAQRHGSPELAVDRLRRGFPKFDEGRVVLSRHTWIGLVSADTWESTVGGYQICKRWWTARRGRTIASDEVSAYVRLLWTLQRGREIQNAIDAVLATVILLPRVEACHNCAQ